MMMKKSWSRKAVSPVIATILMVAITVVLAAVLYVMVMGFGGNTPQAPAVTLTQDSQTKIMVQISPATALGDLKFSYGLAGATAVAMTATTAAYNGLTISFVDVGGDGKVTTGDYFLVTGSKTAPTTTGTLTLLWSHSDTTQSVASIVF